MGPLAQENARLHANLLEMEFGADVRQNEGNTMSCFERALRSPLPDEAKLLFSQRRVEFLEDFGSSIHRYGLGGTPKNGGGHPEKGEPYKIWGNPIKSGETLKKKHAGKP